MTIFSLFLKITSGLLACSLNGILLLFSSMIHPYFSSEFQNSISREYSDEIKMEVSNMVSALFFLKAAIIWS